MILVANVLESDKQGDTARASRGPQETLGAAVIEVEGKAAQVVASGTRFRAWEITCVRDSIGRRSVSREATGVPPRCSAI